MEAISLPKSYSLIGGATFVKNQGNIESCTGFEGVAEVDTQRKREHNEELDFSELFLY